MRYRTGAGRQQQSSGALWLRELRQQFARKGSRLPTGLAGKTCTSVMRNIDVAETVVPQRDTARDNDRTDDLVFAVVSWSATREARIVFGSV